MQDSPPKVLAGERLELGATVTAADDQDPQVLPRGAADRFDELADFLAERHSYDEPEIVAVPIVAGSEAYLSWVEDETRPE